MTRSPRESTLDRLKLVGSFLAMLVVFGCFLVPPAFSDNYNFTGGETAEEEEDEEGEIDPDNQNDCPGKTDPVDVVTGEFILTPEDQHVPGLFIPGARPEISIDLRHSYRSGSPYDSPLGYGWDFAANVRLRQAREPVSPTTEGKLIVSFGNCTTREYFRFANEWYSPTRGDERIVQNGDGSYTMTKPDGRTYDFDSHGLLTRKADRHGNEVLYEWDGAPGVPAKFPLYGRPKFSITDRMLSAIEETAPPGANLEDFKTLIGRDYRLIRVKFPDQAAANDRAVDLRYDPVTGRLDEIEDWTGRIWSYGHDSLGNLTTVSSPPVRTFETLPGGATQVVVEPAVASFAYTDPHDLHNVTEVTSPALQGSSTLFLSQVYDEEGRVTSQTYGDGAGVSLDYTSIPNTTVLTDGNATDWEFEYDPSNFRVLFERVVTRGVRTGEQVGTKYETAYLYDSLGRLTDVTYPESNSTHWEWPLVSGPVEERGNLVYVEERPKPGSTDPPLRTSFQYTTPYQQIETIITPETQTTTFVYDPTTYNLTSIQYPLISGNNDAATIVINSRGQLESFEDSNGNTTRYEYTPDPGNPSLPPDTRYLARVIRAYGSATDEATTSYDPDELGRPTAITTDNGHRTQLLYDELDRLATITRPAPFASQTEERYYDANGNLRQRAMLDSAVILESLTWEYDERDRVEFERNGLANNEIQYFYDGNGNRTGVEDASDYRWTFLFDERDLLYTSTPPAGTTLGPTTFGYHANGTLDDVVDGRGNRTGYGYDPFDRLSSVLHDGDPNSSTDDKEESFEWDMNGDLDLVTTRSGVEVDYVFDNRRRNTFRTIAGGETHSFTYDGAGRMQTAGDSGISIVFGYNERDERTSETVTFLGSGAPTGSRTVEQVIDGAGNRSELIFSNLEDFFLAHDAMERLSQVRAESASAALMTQVFDGRGRRDYRDFSSGVRHDWVFDAAGRVDLIAVYAQHGLPGETILLYRDYELDARGVVESIAFDASPSPASDILTYGHDGARQLTAASFPSAHAATGSPESFQYDAAGNRGGAFVANSLDQYTTVPGSAATVSYDDNGNLDDNGVLDFEWDAESSLTEIRSTQAGPSIATYRHDPFGRRYQKSVAGGDTTWFLWLGEQMIEELDGTGASVKRYVYDSAALAPLFVEDGVAANAELYAVHPDHLGTPAILVDSQEEPVWSSDYRSFGSAIVDENPDGDSVNVSMNLRFPGQYFDSESGLHYNRHRYYDPSSARYVSADPIGQRGGLHLYQYARNSPSQALDPMGLFTFSVGQFTAGGAGAGGQAQLALVADDDGNVGIALTYGVGAEIGAGASTGIVGGLSSADTIFDLEGDSTVTGASAGEGAVAGVDVVDFNSRSGSDEFGVEVQFGLGAGTPVEAHVIPSTTIVEPLFNWKRAIEDLFGDNDDDSLAGQCP
ncbi:MAG: DUF6531 domain-containing protein [bacterium]|nr:DUF6531 domain-containing protein [bacterium]